MSININTLQIFIKLHEIDVSNSSFNKQSHDDDSNEEYDLSSAISEASLEMKQITSIETDEEQELNDDFIESRSQLDEIAQPPDSLYTLNGGGNGKFI